MITLKYEYVQPEQFLFINRDKDADNTIVKFESLLIIYANILYEILFDYAQCYHYDFAKHMFQFSRTLLITHRPAFSFPK